MYPKIVARCMIVITKNRESERNVLICYRNVTNVYFSLRILLNRQNEGNNCKCKLVFSLYRVSFRRMRLNDRQLSCVESVTNGIGLLCLKQADQVCLFTPTVDSHLRLHLLSFILSHPEWSAQRELRLSRCA